MTLFHRCGSMVPLFFLVACSGSSTGKGSSSVGATSASASGVASSAGTVSSGTVSTGATSTSSSGSSSGGSSSSASTSSGSTASSSSGFCPAPTYSLDNGDLGQLCAATLAPDGGDGQGTCAAGERCTRQGSVGEFGCSAAPDDAGVCVQGISHGGSACVPVCNPASPNSCGTSTHCAPLTPGPGAAGECQPTCQVAADCNTLSSTSFTCRAGICVCTEDADCPGLSCDVNSGTCYQPCARNADCATGCCVQEAVSYCDQPADQQPGASSGSTGSGSSSSGSTGGGGSTTGSPWPVLENNGQPGVATPDLVTITFGSGDGGPLQSGMEAYGSWLMQSSWLTTVGAPYGVGLGTAHSARLNVAAPATVFDGLSIGETTQDPATLINDQVTLGTIPPPTPNTVYALYYPASTTIYLSDTAQPSAASCTAFDGYHSWYTEPDGGIYLYAVLPDCSPGETAELSRLEINTSHELIESATDPDFYGWYVNDTTSQWLGQEIADMCESQGLTYVDASTGFSAQRVWSLTAAMGDGSPCVPTPADEPFAGVSGPLTLLHGRAGMTVQVPAQTWSAVPVPEGTLQLFTSEGLRVDPPDLLVSSGDTVTFTVTLPAGDVSGASHNLYLVRYVPGQVDGFQWRVTITVE